MRTYLIAFLLLATCCITSCNSNQADGAGEELIQETELDRFFPDFPASPFSTLQFDQTADQVSESLKKNGYIELIGSEGTWESEDQKTKIIVSPDAKLGNFKLYFFDKKDSFCSKLIEKLEKTAEKVEKSAKNEQFVYFEFETEANSFSISLFHYEKLIRMSYKLKASH